MKKYAITLLLLAMLLAPAIATVTVTINAPPNNSTYSTLTSNRQTIDLNFTVDDDNTATGHDVNVRVTWRSVHTLQGDSATFLLGSGTADLNIFASDYNKTRASNGLMCVGLDQYGEPITCSYTWTMPNDTTMPHGEYIVDVNAEGWCSNCGGTGHDQVNADANASITINIENALANRATLRNLMGVVSVVLVAIVLLGGLTSIVVLKTDVAKTALLTVTAAVATAIGAALIGMLMAAL